MKSFFYFLILLSFSSHAFSATPVTHIFLAEKWIEASHHPLDENQKAAFIVGNLFPDIQYLGEIARDDTHEANVTLADIFSSSSAFLAGKRLHAYIDIMREDLVVQWQIYPHVSKFAQGRITTLLKLIEDEILYDRIQSLPIKNFLSDINEEELATGLSYKTIQKWHKLLTQYLSVRPSHFLEQLAKNNQPFLDIPQQTVKLWSQVIPILAKKKAIVAYVEKLEDAFSQHFQSFWQSRTNDSLLNEFNSSAQILKFNETDDCMISWIQNEKGDLAIVKQIKDHTPDEQFLLVVDALACSIANQSQIPVNRVALIPAHFSLVGKYYPDRIATLHSVVPGLSTFESLPWPDFDVHQRFRKPGSALWQKWGPLSPQETGLSLTVIANMALHPSLPKIVALDTFLGNADRSNPNIFYDSLDDSFCGIDMAASFNTSLAKPACDQLADLIQQNVLSNGELNGLNIYCQTLEKLCDQFSAEKLCALLDTYTQQAGFEINNPLFTPDVQDRIVHHKAIIRENYEYCLQLILLLKELLR